MCLPTSSGDRAKSQLRRYQRIAAASPAGKCASSVTTSDSILTSKCLSRSSLHSLGSASIISVGVQAILRDFTVRISSSSPHAAGSAPVVRPNDFDHGRCFRFRLLQQQLVQPHLSQSYWADTKPISQKLEIRRVAENDTNVWVCSLIAAKYQFQIGAIQFLHKM